MTVIDLGIGSPDQPPQLELRQFFAKAVLEQEAYRYPLTDGEEVFRDAVAQWMRHRFQVTVDAKDEVLSLMGTQDGLAHIPLALINPGDIVLVPNPGYPIYRAAVLIAGGMPYDLKLSAEHDYLPDYQSIPTEIAEKAKLMILNYPSNPLTAVATPQFFKETVAFAQQHQIMVAHDCAYSEMTFDGIVAPSFLQSEGAIDLGVEFNSLSKSFNMAGCRIGFVVGNRKIIAALKQLKSNIDYGVFLPIQQMAAKALSEASSHSSTNVSELYQHRRDLFLQGLWELGWNIPKNKATMFLWANVPTDETSLQFCERVLKESGIVMIPGSAFGTQGEGSVRIALVQEEKTLQQAIERLKLAKVIHT